MVSDEKVIPPVELIRGVHKSIVVETKNIKYLWTEKSDECSLDENQVGAKLVCLVWVCCCADNSDYKIPGDNNGQTEIKTNDLIVLKSLSRCHIWL